MDKVDFIGTDGNIYKRQPCEIFSRVMGYYRPVSHYNNGKKSEFYTRIYFTNDGCNSL